MFWLSRCLPSRADGTRLSSKRPAIFLVEQSWVSNTSHSKVPVYTIGVADSASHQASSLLRLILLAFWASARLVLRCQRADHCKDWHSARGSCVCVYVFSFMASVPYTKSCIPLTISLFADVDLGSHGAPRRGNTKGGEQGKRSEDPVIKARTIRAARNDSCASAAWPLGCPQRVMSGRLSGRRRLTESHTMCPSLHHCPVLSAAGRSR